MADELGSEVPDSFAKLEGDGTEEWSEYHDWAMAALVESAAHSGDQQWTTQLFWVYAPDWLGADRFSVFKCRHGEFPAGRHGVLPTLVAQAPQLASAAAAVRSLRKEPDALGFVLVERGYGARVELDVPTLLWFQGGAEWPTEEVRADWPYLPFMVAWAHDITTGWKAQLIRAHSSNGRPLPGSVLDYNSHKIFSYAPDAWAPHLGWRPVLSRNN